MEKNKYYLAAGYEDSRDIIKESFNSMSENVVKIGFYLKHIRDLELYREGQYTSFGEFVKNEYGLSATSASRYMSINDRFSVDGNSPLLLENKKDFSKSQLQEMLYLTDEQVERVTPDMTVKEIRNMNKAVEIEIEAEQEEQLPGQLDIEFYPEVLPEGYQTTSCDVANDTQIEHFALESSGATAYGWYRSEIVKEYLKTCHKEVQSKCEITVLNRNYKVLKREKVVVFYDADGKALFDVTNERLEAEYNWMARTIAGSDDEVTEADTSGPEVVCEIEQEYVDVEYREVVETLSAYGLSKTEYPPESYLSTAGCGNKYTCFSCGKECEIRQEERYCVYAPLGKPYACTTMNVLENIKNEIGDKCQFINLDLAEHTKGSDEPSPCCKKCKEQCGYRCRYVAGCEENDMQFKERLVKIFAERYRTRLDDATDVKAEVIKILDRVHKSIYPFDWKGEKDTLQSYTVEEKAGELKVRKAGSGEIVVTFSAADLAFMVEKMLIKSTDTEEIDEQRDYESIEFAREVLNGEKRTLRMYMDDKGVKKEAVEKRKIIVAALANMVTELESIEMQEKLEVIENEQPELPKLRNKEERMEFIRNYESWGVWYFDDRLNARYFKYDFKDGSRLIVAQYKSQYVRHKGKNEREWSFPHYHLVKCGGYFSPYATSETAMIDFLKKYQRKNG